MIRYTYLTDLLLADFSEREVTASYSVYDDEIDDIRIDFIDGKPARFCDTAAINECTNLLNDSSTDHHDRMLTEAIEADAEREAERLDRIDEDREERLSEPL